MAHSSSLRGHHVRRLSVLALGVLVVAVLIVEAPHIVHHFFDPAKVTNECPFAARSDRSQLSLETHSAPVVVQQFAAYAPRPLPAVLPGLWHAPASSRAPPLPLAS